MASESNQSKKFILAGMRARQLRKQLAVAWLASQEIIDYMKALRASIPNYSKINSDSKLELNDIQSIDDKAS